MSDDGLQFVHPRIFVEGEEIGEVHDVKWDVKLEPVLIPRPSICTPAPITFTQTFKLRQPSLWRRLWCWSWHGHWPKCQGPFDFAMDHYSCPCGKVKMATEELLDLSLRYDRKPPF